MNKTFLILLRFFKDCFGFWYYLYDNLFNSDEHYIVSKRGWEILNTLNSEELKEFIEKHKNI